MTSWWDKIKKVLILLVVIGVLLSLFLVTAITRVSYEQSLGEASEFAGQSLPTMLPNVIDKPFENLRNMFWRGRSNICRKHEIFCNCIWSVNVNCNYESKQQQRI